MHLQGFASELLNHAMEETTLLIEILLYQDILMHQGAAG